LGHGTCSWPCCGWIDRRVEGSSWRLYGSGGDVEVLAAPTPEEIVEAKAALDGVIKALAEVVVERDLAAMRAGAPGVDE